VPPKPAARARVIAGRDHVRKTRTMKCTMMGDNCNHVPMTGMKIGYARVSTNDQDLTAQCNALFALGVEEAQIFVDHGLTGANRVRPGLRAGDTLVVTKLDRLARSLSDAMGYSRGADGKGGGAQSRRQHPRSN
jgi:predicted site-specific integrase-resolvase